MSASSSDMTTLLSNLLGQGAVTGANILGGNSVANAAIAGDQNAINTQTAVQGQNAGALAAATTANQNQLGTVANTGNAASTNLASYLGLNGQPADFSQFYNTPGYQFAVSQGTNAINSQAAAAGSAFTPNTLAAVGNYVQGAASTNYNNYINQLLSTSQQGLSAGQSIASSNTANTQTGVNSNLTTGNNISQEQVAQGSANASGAANQSSSISSALSALGGAGGVSSLLSGLLGGTSGTSGSNSSGLGGTLGNLGSSVSNLLNGYTNANGSLNTVTPYTNSLYNSQYTNSDGSLQQIQPYTNALDDSEYTNSDGSLQYLDSLYD